MAKKRPPPDALMFRINRNGPPEWRVVDARDVDFFRRFNWVLLADEREIRDQDIEDVREDDERGRR